MDRHVYWQPWDEPGLEHLHLRQDAGAIAANGMILRVQESRPFRFHYEVRCDSLWRVREAVITRLDDRRVISLRSNGEGVWTDGDGAALPHLDGCIDIDISASPFTNTLPIRRLHLKPGAAEVIAVVFIDAPQMQVSVEQQRYTCLESGVEGGAYQFLSLDGGFTARLPVDADGLVLDYPGLFKRVWSA